MKLTQNKKRVKTLFYGITGYVQVRQVDSHINHSLVILN